MAHTAQGRATLRDWLIDPAVPEVVADRQAAVAELAPELDLRQELEVHGRLAAAGDIDADRFVAWAEREPWLASRQWLLWIARGMPLATLLFISLAAFEVVPASLWFVPVMLGVVISFIFCAQVHSIFDLVSSRQGEVRRYSELFHLASQLPGSCTELQRVHTSLGGGRQSPCRRLSILGRIMDLANFRFSPMVYMAVQGLTLWDFHVLSWVERWQRRSGKDVRRWFESLGELEALASLASLSHDHPDWAMAKVHDGGEIRLSASDLGHPLLPDDVCVVNDVTVGPPGTLLLVTGSNMSGKSTLLRALGTNVALAQAGGPVCASDMTLTPLALATSMRIDDSLEQGVSFFMAELYRLKEIVDQAAQYRGHSHLTVLYLLDEILQGTNTVERHIAVERVLAHLLTQQAIGAVSTHDLDLATSPVLKEACQPVHFRESFHAEDGVQRMTFDYRLHPGVATTTNALKLLEIVGLPRVDE
jgi:DNA mismatch repair ATPase MutS